MFNAAGKLMTTAVVVALAGGVYVTVRAQGLGPSSAGSLAELTAEVRQLRVALQDAARGQNQMQALSISLTAQHSRLTQVSQRLDAAQDQLQGAIKKSQEAANMVAEAQRELAAPNATAESRAHLTAMVRMFREQADTATADENRLRTRQSELMSQFQAEESRWLQLVARLEDVLRR